ncbi:MAG: trypsin-like peptidase domain-containing protein [Phycisphaerales bacterium]|nr:trypsin-like peptidase domain-containing protein [Phycisphaerales bacterium]
MTPFRHACFIGILFWLCGCSSPQEVVDGRLELAPDANLDSTVWIGVGPGKRLGVAGSGVVIGPNRLLTNRHFVSQGQRWWMDDEIDSSWTWFAPAEVDSSYRVLPSTLEAAGTIPDVVRGRNQEEIYDDAELLGPLVDADWAILQIDDPPWTAEALPILHAPALQPGWRVPSGTELHILGYSPIFLGMKAGGGISPKSPEYRQFLADGPYAITGKATSVQSMPGVTYAIDRAKPVGHSGGGVYLWNAAASQLELIGLFHGSVPVLDGEVWVAPDGNYTGKGSRLRMVLLYAPIGDIAPLARE